jgi:hypothetical protein
MPWSFEKNWVSCDGRGTTAFIDDPENRNKMALAKLTVPQMRSMGALLDLPTTGLRKELCGRIRDAIRDMKDSDVRRVLDHIHSGADASSFTRPPKSSESSPSKEQLKPKPQPKSQPKPNPKPQQKPKPADDKKFAKPPVQPAKPSPITMRAAAVKPKSTVRDDDADKKKKLADIAKPYVGLLGNMYQVQEGINDYGAKESIDQQYLDLYGENFDKDEPPLDTAETRLVREFYGKGHPKGDVYKVTKLYSCIEVLMCAWDMYTTAFVPQRDAKTLIVASPIGSPKIWDVGTDLFMDRAIMPTYGLTRVKPGALSHLVGILGDHESAENVSFIGHSNGMVASTLLALLCAMARDDELLEYFGGRKYFSMERLIEEPDFIELQRIVRRGAKPMVFTVCGGGGMPVFASDEDFSRFHDAIGANNYVHFFMQAEAEKKMDCYATMSYDRANHKMVYNPQLKIHEISTFDVTLEDAYYAEDDIHYKKVSGAAIKKGTTQLSLGDPVVMDTCAAREADDTFTVSMNAMDESQDLHVYQSYRTAVADYLFSKDKDS